VNNRMLSLHLQALRRLKASSFSLSPILAFSSA
jgi:hypothetical protein